MLKNRKGVIALQTVQMVIVTEEDTPRLALDPPLSIEREIVAASSKELREVIRELSRVEKTWETAERILIGLKRGWQDIDPGKYGANYSFVITKDSVESISVGHKVRVVVRELLSEDAIFQGTEDQWRNRFTHLHRVGYDQVPPSLPIVAFADVAKAPCPNCGTLQPLIRSHEQTEDSPMGDSWARQYLVICCGDIHILDSKGSDYRISD